MKPLTAALCVVIFLISTTPVHATRYKPTPKPTVACTASPLPSITGSPYVTQSPTPSPSQTPTPSATPFESPRPTDIPSIRTDLSDGRSDNNALKDPNSCLYKDCSGQVAGVTKELPSTGSNDWGHLGLVLVVGAWFFLMGLVLRKLGNDEICKECGKLLTEYSSKNRVCDKCRRKQQ